MYTFILCLASASQILYRHETDSHLPLSLQNGKQKLFRNLEVYTQYLTLKKERKKKEFTLQNVPYRLLSRTTVMTAICRLNRTNLWNINTRHCLHWVCYIQFCKCICNSLLAKNYFAHVLIAGGACLVFYYLHYTVNQVLSTVAVECLNMKHIS